MADKKISELDIAAAVTDDSAFAIVQGQTTKQVSGEQIKDYVSEISTPVYGMGKNFLDNAYFIGGGSQQGGCQFPINRRGLTSYTSNGYIVDRWSSTRSNTVTVESDGLKLEFSTGQAYQQIAQNLENGEKLAGKIVTISALIESTKDIVIRYIYKTESTIDIYESTDVSAGTNGLVQKTFEIPSDATKGAINITSLTSLYTDGYFKVKAIKLELGSQQTLAHLEGSTWVVNEIPNYEEELARCTTSTGDPSDTYANTPLANEGEIAKILKDNVAGHNVAVDEYVVWKGKLYTANTAISSSMSASTFASYLTPVSDGGLNKVQTDFHRANTMESLLDCNGCSTPLQVYQALISNPGATGAGDIGTLQSSQLKNFLTNPFYNYTHVTFEFVSTGLIKVIARNTVDATNPGKVCYLKGIINNLLVAENWSVTTWEDVTDDASLAKVLSDPAGQSVAKDEYVIYNGDLYISPSAIADNTSASSYASGLIPVPRGGLNNTLYSKDYYFSTNVLGTSFSPTSRSIGHVSTLFGLTERQVKSIMVRNNNFTPASNLVLGMYNGYVYVAATQSCTLSDTLPIVFTVVYSSNYDGALIPAMTSATTPKGTVSASSYFGANYAPYMAFNGSKGTLSNIQNCWLAASTDNAPSLTYEFDKAYPLSRMWLELMNNSTAYTVTAYIYGRTASGTWENCLLSGSSISLTFPNLVVEEKMVDLNGKTYNAIRILGNETWYKGANKTACGFSRVQVYSDY